MEQIIKDIFDKYDRDISKNSSYDENLKALYEIIKPMEKFQSHVSMACGEYVKANSSKKIVRLFAGGIIFFILGIAFKESFQLWSVICSIISFLSLATVPVILAKGTPYSNIESKFQEQIDFHLKKQVPPQWLNNIKNEVLLTEEQREELLNLIEHDSLSYENSILFCKKHC